MKVHFYSSIEDSIYVSEQIHRRISKTPNNWDQLYSYYIFGSILAFPALVMFFGYFSIGLIIFAVSLFTFIFLSRIVQKERLRDFYKSVFDEDGTYLEIELSEIGIGCKRSNGLESLWSWNNLIDIQETKNSVYFFTKGNGIGIPKTAFQSIAHKQDFVAFAEDRRKPKKYFQNA